MKATKECLSFPSALIKSPVVSSVVVPSPLCLVEIVKSDNLIMTLMMLMMKLMMTPSKEKKGGEVLLRLTLKSRLGSLDLDLEEREGKSRVCVGGCRPAVVEEFKSLQS